jgi:hypothetical protein
MGRLGCEVPVSRFHYGPVLLDTMPDDERSVRESVWMADAPLVLGDRFPVYRDCHVPEQLSTTDGAVAAWVATGETLRNPGLAFAVIRRAPDVDAFPERDAPFDAEAARAAVRDLRTGKAVATSIVVRIACHMLETT